MRNIYVVVFVFMFSSGSVFSQKKMTTKIDSIAYDMAYTKYNLYKFHSQHQTGTIFTIIGVGLNMGAVLTIPMAMQSSNQDYTVPYMFAGAGCLSTLIGQIIIIDSYKWIKRATIKPNNYGISINFYLNSITEPQYNESD